MWSVNFAAIAGVRGSNLRLEIVPSRLRLFQLGHEPFAAWLGLRHFPPGPDHRFAIGAFAISGDGWWSIPMTTLFDLLHQFLRGFFFGLGDRPADSESRLDFDR